MTNPLSLSKVAQNVALVAVDKLATDLNKMPLTHDQRQHILRTVGDTFNKVFAAVMTLHEIMMQDLEEMKRENKNEPE